MAYYLNVFSPETYEAFTKSGGHVSGFSVKQESAAEKVHKGDKLVCYVTRLSCWVGILEITSTYYEDSTPIYGENDPFIIRFKVQSIVWLELEKAVPIREDQVWKTLSFTKDHDKNSTTWTARLRVPLGKVNENDGKFLEKVLLDQRNAQKTFEIDTTPTTHEVKYDNKLVTVAVPEESGVDTEDLVQPANEVRESIKIQALIATIGSRMGMSIWLPRNDRSAVLSQWKSHKGQLLEDLPLHYDSATLSTIEQIDVLWLLEKTIIRAFEVEHTTAIYSGILRMADLLTLQPNIDVSLHIVAPSDRRSKVFQQLQRPVFSMGKKPLSKICTYLTYESIQELAQQKHLEDMRDSVIDRYAEKV